jgi:murein L,D-transpeptidase YafK
MKTIFNIILLMSVSFAASSADFLPSTIYKMDKRFTHHILVVEKSTHSLYLYKYGENEPKLVKKFRILTGKFTGNKTIQGDKKTPEGIYFFQRFYSADNLINKYGDYGKIYGAGAFTTNYPNIIDARKGKTGGGIWLHSTDYDNRISLGLDSRGCVVAVDKDLKEISQYIDLANTPIIIVQNLYFESKSNWNKNKAAISNVITNWMKSWQQKDFKSYISSYSPTEFKHSRRGRYQAYKNYKRSVFSRTDTPNIVFEDLSILHNGEYVVATMVQNYSSPLIKDVGRKTLYLKKDKNYQWKIVSEEWSKLPDDVLNEIAIVPTKKNYFSENTKKELVDDDSGSI